MSADAAGTPSSQGRAFGFSRAAFYAARRAFELGGLPALLPAKPGPRRPHKLADDVLTRLRAERTRRPGVTAVELAEMVAEGFDVQVHPRSDERPLARPFGTDSP